MVCRIEIDKQINITLVVEPIGEDRAKDRQGLDLVLETKVDDSLHVQFNQLHKPVMSEISLYASRYCVTSSLRSGR